MPFGPGEYSVRTRTDYKPLKEFILFLDVGACWVIQGIKVRLDQP